MKSIEKVVNVIENTMGMVILTVMVMIVALQVASRYLFPSPISWTEEASRYCLIWLTFLGASMVIRTKGHFAVEYLLQKIHGRILVAVELFLLLMMVYFAAVMLYVCLEIMPIVHYQISPALQIPMSYVYAAIPVGSTFMLIHLVTVIIERLSVFTSGRYNGNGIDIASKEEASK
jgi:TRAP-type C4-dicarboxylate transport system permease small subunit